MSSVPYIFAGDYGNIPLSELDANFANVKANVDYATVSGNSTLAETVTASSQPAITSLGTLVSLSVTGNITTGNYFIGNGSQLTGITFYGNSNVVTLLSGFGSNTVSTTGNITGGNIRTSGQVSATSNITGGNILTSGLISATANITGGNILTGGLISATSNITGGNILTGGLISATSTITASANITGGNILTGGLISAAANITSGGAFVTTVGVKNTGLELVGPNYIDITANAQTANLSATTSTNFLIANNTGYTVTVNMPAGPIAGQITRFAVAGNTVTLVVGTGTVDTSFSGSATVGSGFEYVYRNATATWYKSI